MLSLTDHAAAALTSPFWLGIVRCTAALARDLLHKLLPGLGAPTPIRVGPGTLAVGKTLTDINLRGLTGATVLAIVRERDGVLTPTGREILQPGDLLAVAGTAEAVQAAQALLAQEDD